MSDSANCLTLNANNCTGNDGERFPRIHPVLTRLLLKEIAREYAEFAQSTSDKVRKAEFF